MYDELGNNFWWLIILLSLVIIFIFCHPYITTLITNNNYNSTNYNLSYLAKINGHLLNHQSSSSNCIPMRRDYKLSNLGPKDFDDKIIMLKTDVEKHKENQMILMNRNYENLEDDILSYNNKPKNLFIIP